jgi:hypothetical protein
MGPRALTWSHALVVAVVDIAVVVVPSYGTCSPAAAAATFAVDAYQAAAYYTLAHNIQQHSLGIQHPQNIQHRC